METILFAVYRIMLKDAVIEHNAADGWMDRRIFLEWLKEPRTFSPAPDGIIQHLFCDNASGHYETSEVKAALQLLNTELRNFPAQTTDSTQPLDSFIIAEFKSIWRQAWDIERSIRVENKMFSARSGKLNHPGRHWYMKLAKKCADAVNSMEDENGMRLTRKAMIRSGLSLDTDGTWRVAQLYGHLQEVIAKYPENFNGIEPVKPT